MVNYKVKSGKRVYGMLVSNRTKDYSKDLPWEVYRVRLYNHKVFWYTTAANLVFVAMMVAAVCSLIYMQFDAVVCCVATMMPVLQFVFGWCVSAHSVKLHEVKIRVGSRVVESAHGMKVLSHTAMFKRAFEDYVKSTAAAEELIRVKKKCKQDAKLDFAKLALETTID